MPPAISMRRRSPAGLALFLVLAGCSGADRGDLPASAVRGVVPASRDSAGVLILEHAGDALERAPRIVLDPVPLAIVGDTTIDLAGATAPIVLRTGDIAYGTHGVVHIAHLAADSIEHIAHAGQGPGEFSIPALSRAGDDTILVSDYDNGRLSWVVPGRGVVRERRVALTSGPYPLTVIGVFPDDTMILGPYGQRATPTGDRALRPVARLAPGADSASLVQLVEGVDLVRFTGRMAEQRATGPVLFSPDAAIVAWGNGYLAARSDRWQLDGYRLDGTLARSVRLPVERVPVTPAMRDADAEATIRAIRRQLGDRAPAGLDALRDAPFADALPVWSDVLGTPKGAIWVIDARLASDTLWAASLIDGDGAILGRLRGAGRPPVGFGDDRAVFRDRDLDDVITFRIHHLRFPD